MTLSDALHQQAEALRAQANALDALAMANMGEESDLLKSSEVQSLLHCGATKAWEILRQHGTGTGKMARIERGKLMDLQRNGRL